MRTWLDQGLPCIIKCPNVSRSNSSRPKQFSSSRASRHPHTKGKSCINPEQAAALALLVALELPRRCEILGIAMIGHKRVVLILQSNVHMQTLEYRNRQSSLNAAQIVTTGERDYRIVISAKDPGEPNWLDTEGHARGSIFWRFLLPAEDPPKPTCTVVTI